MLDLGRFLFLKQFPCFFLIWKYWEHCIKKVSLLNLTAEASFICSWKIFTWFFHMRRLIWLLPYRMLVIQLLGCFLNKIHEMHRKSVILKASWTSINLFENSMALFWWTFLICFYFPWLQWFYRPSQKLPRTLKIYCHNTFLPERIYLKLGLECLCYSCLLVFQ